jgi:hypothetical protein
MWYLTLLYVVSPQSIALAMAFGVSGGTNSFMIDAAVEIDDIQLIC